MVRDDPRLMEAKCIPVAEVLDRIGVTGLRAAGAERVGPCPLCGGRDRFGIHMRRALFQCRKCGIKGGDQVALVQAVLGLSFPDALKWLCGDAPAHIDPEELARRRARARAEEKRREEYEAKARRHAIEDAGRIWRGALRVGPDGGMVAQYLARRGVVLPEPWPPVLRLVPSHAYVKRHGGAAIQMHLGPAMVALVQLPDGNGGAVHQTWIDLSRAKGKACIDHEGAAQPSKLVRGSKKGGAIRLITPAGADTLVMGEGIETTLTAYAARAVPGAAYWAGVDLGNMSGRMLREAGNRYSGRPDMDDDRAFVPPPWVRRLIFIQDGDSHPAATRAKLLSGCRRAMALRPGLRAQIVHAGDGVDLNDLVTPDE